MAREARKVPAASQPGPSSALPLEDHSQDYHLIKMGSLMRAVGVFSCCGSPLTICENRSTRKGLVTKISICCSVCGKQSLLTDPYNEEDLKVNTRSVLAARVIGRGRGGLAAFTGFMGMLPPITSNHFTLHNEKIRDATEVEKDLVIAAAAAELRKGASDNEIVDVKVTCDATWQ
jgi:hypothetical protein